MEAAKDPRDTPLQPLEGSFLRPRQFVPTETQTVYGSIDCTPLPLAVIPLKTKFADAYTCQANNLTRCEMAGFCNSVA